VSIGSAFGWGAVAASSLVIGAVAALAHRWSSRPVGVVLAFGAGALISAVSFDLAEEGAATGGIRWVGLGLALGAVAYFLADRQVDRMQSGAGGAGVPLAVGAFLDGIPEQLVLGIGIASGEGVGVGLLLAIFVSNLPEAIGSASEMQDAGRPRGAILKLWLVVAVLCALATPAGFALADAAGGRLRAVIDGFAAGALLVMLVDSMIPDATRRAGRIAGLVTTLGFAVAWGCRSPRPDRRIRAPRPPCSRGAGESACLALAGAAVSTGPTRDASVSPAPSRHSGAIHQPVGRARSESDGGSSRDRMVDGLLPAPGSAPWPGGRVAASHPGPRADVDAGERRLVCVQLVRTATWRGSRDIHRRRQVTTPLGWSAP
jgi:ZIP family zinc transporter